MDRQATAAAEDGPRAVEAVTLAVAVEAVVDMLEAAVEGATPQAAGAATVEGTARQVELAS